MTTPARSAFVATALLLTFSAGPAAQTTTVPALPADFPQEDGMIWSMVQQKGLVAKLAAQSLKAAPDSPDTVHLLVRAERPSEALDVLVQITKQHPKRLPDALRFANELAMQLMRAEFRDRVQPLRDLVPVIRSQLATLPREDAARAARHLMGVENQLAQRGSTGWAERLDAFRQEWAGTEMALFAEAEAFSMHRGSYAERLEAIDTFVLAHPGTAAAARALYQKGWDLAVNGQLAGIEPPRGDPLKRLLMVQAVVTELESGKYPRNEFTDKAGDLIARFSAYQPTYGPGSVERILSVYEDFATSHFGDHPYASMAYFVSHRIGELHALKGDRDAGVERLLGEVARNPAHAPAARYMLAECYLSNPQTPLDTSRTERVAKAREVLAALYAGTDGLYQRKALAKLAVVEFAERSYDAAVRHLKMYLTRYPDSPWAWIAAMRLGHAHTALGDWAAALAVYADAAKRFADVPPARVLAHAYAARAHEALGQFDASLKDHELAVTFWDTDYGSQYALYFPRQMKSDQPNPAGREDIDISKASLESRVSTLRRTLASPGAPMLERARWLFARARFDEAASSLEELLAQHPRSPLAAEGREFLHRVQVTRALDRADTAELERVVREPFDFWVAAATMAKAGYAWKAGDKELGEALMMSALMAWQKHQPNVSPAEPPNALERDVLEVRRLVFRPRGDGLFAGTRWELKSLAPGNPAFFVARQSIDVKLADGELTRVRVDRRAAEFPNVLFWNADQLAFFDLLLAKVGGTETRTPTGVMEVPNQPVGGSKVILELLKKFFPSRPGHWGGWMVETFPMITRIDFADAARTKAAVHFTVGYEGATAVLEKTNGVWTFKEMTNRWIT